MCIYYRLAFYIGIFHFQRQVAFIKAKKHICSLFTEKHNELYLPVYTLRINYEQVQQSSKSHYCTAHTARETKNGSLPAASYVKNLRIIISSLNTTNKRISCQRTTK